MKSLITNMVYAIRLSFCSFVMTAVTTLSVQAAIPTDESLVELVKVVKLDETIKQMNSDNKAQKSVVEALLPIIITDNMSDTQRQHIEKVVSDYASNVFNDEYIRRINTAYVDAYISAAKKYYTQEEINAQIDFYSTEIGESIAKKQPSMTQDYAHSITDISFQLLSNELKRALPILIQEFKALDFNE